MDMKNQKKRINIYSISILSTLKILKSCLNSSCLNLVNPYPS
jgi:hypothetical protein